MRYSCRGEAASRPTSPYHLAAAGHVFLDAAAPRHNASPSSNSALASPLGGRVTQRCRDRLACGMLPMPDCVADGLTEAELHGAGLVFGRDFGLFGQCQARRRRRQGHRGGDQRMRRRGRPRPLSPRRFPARPARPWLCGTAASSLDLGSGAVRCTAVDAGSAASLLSTHAHLVGFVGRRIGSRQRASAITGAC